MCKEENVQNDFRWKTNLINSGNKYLMVHLLYARHCSQCWGYCMNKTKCFSSWSFYASRGDTQQSRGRD